MYDQKRRRLVLRTSAPLREKKTTRGCHREDKKIPPKTAPSEEDYFFGTGFTRVKGELRARTKGRYSDIKRQ